MGNLERVEILIQQGVVSFMYLVIFISYFKNLSRCTCSSAWIAFSNFSICNISRFAGTFSVNLKFVLNFMHLWPTYYTLEIRVYFLNLPQFSAHLQILYISQISFCGMLYLAGYYVYLAGCYENIISRKRKSGKCTGRVL
jgi:hypothetical protein